MSVKAPLYACLSSWRLVLAEHRWIAFNFSPAKSFCYCPLWHFFLVCLLVLARWSKFEREVSHSCGILVVYGFFLFIWWWFGVGLHNSFALMWPTLLRHDRVWSNLKRHPIDHLLLCNLIRTDVLHFDMTRARAWTLLLLYRGERWWRLIIVASFSCLS